jgi:CRP-like cAMP-binding protein
MCEPRQLTAICGGKPPQVDRYAMAPRKTRAFDTRLLLESAGLGKRTISYPGQRVIFSQGDPCDSVWYIRRGAVQLSVLSPAGREAIVGSGDLLGESALAGRPVRHVTATTTAPTTLLVVAKEQMVRRLHSQHAFSDRFIEHMVARNARLEADLVDQLCNSTEKRLARTLRLLACYVVVHQQPSPHSHCRESSRSHSIPDNPAPR